MSFHNMRHKLRWVCGIVTLLGLILLLGFVPWSTNIPLGGGGSARVKSSSFWRKLFPEANAEIRYKPNDGQVGAVVLWQDFFDGPVTVFHGRNQNVLFCLYDDDVQLYLLRIDTSKSFNTLQPNSVLCRILFTSTWDIREADGDDWQEALAYLRNVNDAEFATRSMSVGVRHYTPKGVLTLLEYQHIK